MEILKETGGHCKFGYSYCGPTTGLSILSGIASVLRGTKNIWLTKIIVWCKRILLVHYDASDRICILPSFGPVGCIPRYKHIGFWSNDFQMYSNVESRMQTLRFGDRIYFTPSVISVFWVLIMCCGPTLRLTLIVFMLQKMQIKKSLMLCEQSQFQGQKKGHI